MADDSLGATTAEARNVPEMKVVFASKRGKLYRADCLDLLRSVKDRSAQMFFADPPFNLGKHYGRHGSDQRSDTEYVEWMQLWIAEAARILAPGGSLFLYNLPKWLLAIGGFLNSLDGLTFRHWIAISMPNGYPIAKRLYPSHYGLLYYVKGDRPRTFNRDRVRTPISTCRRCGAEIKDYGGHRGKLNPLGINLSDVWTDVAPVRHRARKHSKACELHPLILERVILLATDEDDLVIDPFVGSGTTAVIAEQLKRRWICGDLNSHRTAATRLRAALQ